MPAMKTILEVSDRRAADHRLYLLPHTRLSQRRLVGVR